MGKFYQSIQSYGPSFMTKFCSALYLENSLTNIFAKLNLRGGVSCMPAALLFIYCEKFKLHVSIKIVLMEFYFQQIYHSSKTVSNFPYTSP